MLPRFAGHLVSRRNLEILPQPLLPVANRLGIKPVSGVIPDEIFRLTRRLEERPRLRFGDVRILPPELEQNPRR